MFNSQIPEGNILNSMFKDIQWELNVLELVRSWVLIGIPMIVMARNDLMRLMALTWDFHEFQFDLTQLSW